ncbi:MAG TPA: hypothetical protein VN903_28640 [Polyangia bacterium]|nr:hypothetical protein [Polyangia bacterium]
MTATKDEVIVKKAAVELPCLLTDSEFRDRAKQLANVEADMGALDARHESMKQQIKQETAALESRRAELSGIVDRGSEFRMVAIEIRHNFATGRVLTTRLDTGEIYNDRPMTADERQRSLPLKSAESKH